MLLSMSNEATDFLILYSHSAANANGFGLWPILFESRPPEKSWVCVPVKFCTKCYFGRQSKLLSKASLLAILLASCWFQHFSSVFFLGGEMGPGLPVGVRKVDLTLVGLSLCLQWFYSDPLSRTAGCDPGRCGTANTGSIEKLWAFSEALIKGAGCFGFTLLSPWISWSQISLMKLGLFVCWQDATELYLCKNIFIFVIRYRIKCIIHMV